MRATRRRSTPSRTSMILHDRWPFRDRHTDPLRPVTPRQPPSDEEQAERKARVEKIDAEFALR
jgi:hypothetical protein